MNKETAGVQFAYSGEAVANGSMEVRQFAPALLAMSDLIYEANARLNGDLASVSVRVDARYHQGSFLTSLSVVQALSGLLASDQVKTAETLVKALGLARSAGVGLIQLAKKLGGRPYTKAAAQSGGIQFNFSDSFNNSTVSLVVTRDVAELFEDGPVRKALSEVIKTVEREGINAFEVRDGDDVIESVEKGDVPSFAPPEFAIVEEHPSVMEGTLLAVESAGFRETLRWRFSDGTSSFPAKISDKKFLKEVDEGRPFAKGYILVVDLKRTVRLDAKGSLHTDNEILKVHKVLPRSNQLPLFDDGV